MIDSTTLTQFVKYGIVGLISNGVLYVIYLSLTTAGLGPKLAMSLMYCLGTLQTFIFNRQWTFKSQARKSSAFYKYVTTYLIGYVVNYIVLVVAVDIYQLPHQLVQGIMILMLAIGIFILQKFWVFDERSTSPKPNV